MSRSTAVCVFSSAIQGLHALPIEVEVDSTAGLPVFNIVGLPDKAVEESKDRIASAIKNSGFTPPHQTHRRIVVNLAPADIKKEGSGYDLPIAIGYLMTTQQITVSKEKIMCVGELSLDGSLRRVPGMLAIATSAAKNKFQKLIIPEQNVEEARIVNGIDIIGIKNLRQMVDFLENKISIEPAEPLRHQDIIQSESSDAVDFNDIKGQEHAKRALEIGASGHHNLLMFGPPGSGKSLLAQALVGILPELSYNEALEVTNIYSICGLTNQEPLITRRPFRKPHHTTSSAAIIGGGSIPKPGEISLAHRGVLFLDELPEFPRGVLESLRQPLENGEVTISRARASLHFPAQFMLLAAMNPCPCGHYGSQSKPCTCPAGAVDRYQKRISGPLMDRIDIFVKVGAVIPTDFLKINKNSKNAEIKKKIALARDIQRDRFKNSNIFTNSEMKPKDLQRYCVLSQDCQDLLTQAMTHHSLSARAYYKIIKVSRTIADLEQNDNIKIQHMAEALSYRVQVSE